MSEGVREGDEMVVSFASFSERDEAAECKYGNSVDDLR